MSKQTIISMLVADTKLSLFTVSGTIMEIKNDDTYDTPKIIEYLTERLNGTNTVEIDLNDFATESLVGLTDQEGYEDGQIVIQTINEKEVEGIFFAKKPQVAVRVDGENVVIPDVSNLSAQIKRSQEDGTNSVTNFLKRLAPVMKERKHSAEDLMKFIKGSELPLTEDGRVIVYKRVRKTDKKGVYVDCHSGKIKQRVGSRVMMDVKLVDDNNRNDCSQGLHVANLGYSFSGDTILMILVSPENFIAVPTYDKSKARVCEYDIIGVMTPGSYKLVDQCLPMKDDATMELLIQKAVTGQLPPPIEEVHVGRKTLLKVVPLTGKGKPKATKKKTSSKTVSGKPLKVETAEEKKSVGKQIVKAAKKAKNKVLGKKDTMTVAEKFKSLYGQFDAGDLAAFDEMVALKKAKKKSWKALGFSQARIKRIEKQISNPPLFQPKPTPVPTKGLTVKEQARELYNQFSAGNLASFDILVDLKTKKKKGWKFFGFTDAEIKKITTQLSQ